MKKGLALQTIVLVILALIVFFIIAYGFSTKAQNIFFLTKQMFGVSEPRCERSGLGLSSYKGKFVVAEEELAKQTQGTPGYLESREKLVQLYEEYKQCRFTEEPSLSPPGLLALARYYGEKGNAAAAISLYEAYVAQISGSVSPDVLNEMYLVYKDTKNHDKAIMTLRRIANEHPGTKEGESAQYRIGRYMQTVLNDPIKAKQEYTKLRKGKFYGELAEYEIALIEFNEGKASPYPVVLKGEPEKEIESLLDKAHAFENEGKAEEAIKWYRQVAVKTPSSKQGVFAQYKIGDLYWKKIKNLPQAITELSKVPKYGQYGLLASLLLHEAKLEAKGINKEKDPQANVKSDVVEL